MITRSLLIALIVFAVVGQSTSLAQNDGSFSLFIRVEPAGERKLNVTVDATANNSSYDPKYSRTRFGISVQIPQSFSIGFPQCVGDCVGVKLDPVSNTVSSALSPQDRVAATLVFVITADADVRNDEHYTITAKIGSKFHSATFTLEDGTKQVLVNEKKTQSSSQQVQGKLVSTDADRLDVGDGQKIKIVFRLELIGASDFGVILPEGVTIVDSESGCIDADTGLVVRETKDITVNCSFQNWMAPNQESISSLMLSGGSYNVAVVLRVEDIDRDTEVKVFAGSPRTGYEEISVWLVPAD